MRFTLLNGTSILSCLQMFVFNAFHVFGDILFQNDQLKAEGSWCLYNCQWGVLPFYYFWHTKFVSDRLSLTARSWISLMSYLSSVIISRVLCCHIELWWLGGIIADITFGAENPPHNDGLPRIYDWRSLTRRLLRS